MLPPRRPTRPAPVKTILHRLHKALALAALLLLAGFTLACAHAADADTKIEPDKVLDAARAQINAVQKKLDALPDKALDDTQLAELRTTALDAQAQAETVAAAIGPQLTSVNARLAELGVPAEGAPEAPDVAVQRKQLTKNSSTLDAQVKLARLIAVEAGQTAEQLLKLRRTQFQAQLGERTSSILAATFWEDLLDESPRDLRRLAPLREELEAALGAAGLVAYIGALLGVALIFTLRALAGRALMRMSTTRIAPGRLRRSLHALVLVLLGTATPGLVAGVLCLGIGLSASLSGSLASLLNQWVGIACFGGFVAGLGKALLAPDRPSWRLPRIDDQLALRLRWFPLALAIVISLGWAAQRLSILVNASLVATVAQDCIMALALGIIIVLAMLRVRRASRPAADDAQKAPAPSTPIWLAIVLGALWLAVIFSIASLLVGYVALGSFIAKQLVWFALVAGSTYLITGLIDDACASLLASAKRHGGDESNARPMSRARSQAIVLLSGVARLLVVLFALTLLLSPFGGGAAEWLRQLDHLHTGIAIGEVQIRPTAVLTAILVLLLGFGVVRQLQHWLADQYLPTTGLDPGMRLSAATLFGYAGYVVAISLALSAVGISLERVAWIASALSVGIGFGLQAVVQNFVSGLILLAERPVKVGDWVALGGVEGDIRRINVRATEIQMGDRSTVIVPNSEFITKVVRNVTHANPLGRVQIKLALPVNTHAEKVHGLMLAALQENGEVLDEPAPDVMLDGIDATGLVFNATGYVGSPRAAYRVRSALLFEILKQLREAGLPLVNPPTMVLKEQDRADTAAPDISAFGGAADSGTQSPDKPAPEKD
ncbi:DUF3772 domain-containing protein [Pollutimonas bauzanensis]|uniref:Small-conductance mechanosensitive channel n=1 Tax=Pollutimonas bauzanensis TaxID=658167 RepID=A0A1M5Z094_9BURK|nr:DUF3772 domain-containing protein [Pollutimonas bauzanensis]SHI17609.1 Small-conductance mechanosensitive channel [Pollutimonas bauzanensis]